MRGVRLVLWVSVMGTAFAVGASASLADTVELNDGTVHKGKVVADSPEVVGFKTGAGKLLMIKRVDIKELKKDPAAPTEPKEKKEVQKEEDAPEVPKAKAEPSPSTTVYGKWPFDAAEAKRRQAETARALGASVEQEVDLGNGMTLTLVLIPAGEFVMGSTDQQIRAAIAAQSKTSEAFDRRATKEEWFKNEKPARKVTVSKPFFLGKYEVTQEQWDAVMGKNAGNRKEPKNPVEFVPWKDIQLFLDKASERTAAGRCALPTEAQWEYAC